MSYQLSTYILNTCINQPNIDYSWDDTDVEKKLDKTSVQPIIQKMADTSIRARQVLLIGISEWIVGRFQGFFEEQTPYQVLESAWCDVINKYYAPFIDISRHEYLGPVKGALWYGFMTIIPFLRVSNGVADPDAPEDENFDDLDLVAEENINLYGWEKALSFLIVLTEHILPSKDKVALFHDWLNQAVNRLRYFYTVPKEEPFANLFGYKDNKAWLGDYVAREVLDLDFPYHPKDAVKLCDQFLQQVDYRNNPLLVPPQQLTGKIKHPYRLME